MAAHFSAAVVWHALLLTMLGASGTALGGLMIVASPSQPSTSMLGLIQGLAAGLMLCISMLDLMPNAVEAVGFPVANGSFFAGVAFFAMIVALVPEPDCTALLGPQPKDKDLSRMGARRNSYDHLAPGGGMGARRPSIEAALGHAHLESGRGKTHRARGAQAEVLSSGLITALGIAIHNFPEGIAVFLASMKGGTLGLTLAVAIALHNIPEGVAVAMPVYFATRSRWQAMKLTLLSGLAEPAAVVVVGLFFPVDLSEHLVECMLAGVAGIMTFLVVHEMMPLAIEHVGRKGATASLFVGMACMSASLHLLNSVSV